MKKLLLILCLLLLWPQIAFSYCGECPCVMDGIYFFDNSDDAIDAALACAAPDDATFWPSDTETYCPSIDGWGNTSVCATIPQDCRRDLEPHRLSCYYYFIEEEEDCCKEEELAPGQCCPSGKPVCPKVKVGNPISVLSGENEEAETDLQFSTSHKKGLKFYRTYKNQSETDTTLGYGWTHNYYVVLDLLGRTVFKAFTITDESGRIHYFQDSDGDGICTGILGTRGYLVAELDDTYTWHRGNGIKYTFNQQLQFIAKADGNGNVQTLAYNADDRLETVTDQATGRTIGFGYNADGRIAQITGPVTMAIPDGIWVTYQYDTEGNLTHVIYADNNNGSTASGFEYKYEDSYDVHNLTEKRNLAGEFLSSWTYDSQDRAYENVTRDGKGVTISGLGSSSVTVTDAQGVEKIYTIRSNKGRKYIANITGGSCASCGGDAVRYGYDGQRRVNEIEYANGRIDTYSDFDADDRYHTEVQNAGSVAERTFTYDYHPDTGDRLFIRESSILGAGDKETIFDYDDDSNTVPNENPTRLMHRKIERGFTRDSAGTVTAFEHITTYTYDAKGNVLTIDGPLPGTQDTITYTYDPITGDRLSETRPLVGATYFTYDDAGNVETVTDANGIVTTITYDGRNRQLATTRNGVATSRTYTAAGELDSTTDALNRTMDYTYNVAGFMEKIIDPSGNFMYYGYNSIGQREEESLHAVDETVTHLRQTDYGDPANNPDLPSGKPWKSIHRNVDDSADLETVYAYDSSGNLTAVTDANGKVTSYAYDLFNRLLQVTQPGDVTTAYSYDLHGNLASVTDAEGHVTGYTYDDLGRLVQTDSPDTGTTLYSYDETGNLRFKIQNGKIVEYRYDLLGRLTDILYSDAAQNVAMTYDSGPGANLLGRLASVTDPSGTVNYSYDSDGRLESETRTVNGTTYVTGYGYDDAGNLRAITYPTGHTVAYQPDAVDPARIGAVTLNGSQTLVSGIAYQPFGPVSSMMMGNSVLLSKDYDLNYQLLDLHYANGTTVMDRTYTPDNVGNIVSVTDHLDAGRSQSFGYDDLYRLTSASGIYGAIDYTYDKVGNRQSRTRTGTNPAQDSYHYDTGTNRLQTVVGDHAELIQYDADGNTTQRIPGAGNPTPAVTDPADYIYNSSGQRALKDRVDDVIYHYDLAGQLIAETDGSGNMIKAYVWLHGQPLAMIDAGGGVYYYHNDHLGTPQRMTDQSANIVWAADYLPFGKADVTVGVVENNLRFAGQYYDQETGLHYNWNRYYDPSLGRYLRADPYNYSSINNNGPIINNMSDRIFNKATLNTSYKELIDYSDRAKIYNHIQRKLLKDHLSNPLQQNLYLYTAGNPVNYYDFNGFMTCEDKCNIVGAIFCGIEGAAIGVLTGPAGWIVGPAVGISCSIGQIYVCRDLCNRCEELTRHEP